MGFMGFTTFIWCSLTPTFTKSLGHEGQGRDQQARLLRHPRTRRSSGFRLKRFKLLKATNAIGKKDNKLEAPLFG